MSKIYKALFFSSVSQYLAIMINLVSIVIFARLLTPSELGVYAIASSATMLVNEVKLLGTGGYLVREAELTKEKIRSGIGLTLLISWILGLIFIIIAPWVGTFYNQPDLQIILIILSSSFFLAPFISVTNAILAREFRFGEIMVIRLGSITCGFALTLYLVLQGYSYFSLAWGLVFQTVCNFSITLYFKPDYMSWLPSFKGFKPILKFGIFTSLTSLLKRFDETAPDLIIGKLGTPSQVAMFSRGSGLLSFVTQILVTGIRPVVLPFLSDINKNQGNVEVAYIKATTLLGSISWPAIAVVGAASYPAIMLMFGNQWIDAVPIASIMALAFIFRNIHSITTPLLITAKKEKIMFWKQLIVFCITLLGIYLSYPYGLSAIAWSMVIAAIIDFLLSSWAIKISIGLGFFKFFYAMRLNIFLTITCWATTKILDQMLDFHQLTPILSIVIIAIILPITWFLCVMILNHPIYAEIKFVFKSGKKYIMNKKS